MGVDVGIKNKERKSEKEKNCDLLFLGFVSIFRLRRKKKDRLLHACTSFRFLLIMLLFLTLALGKHNMYIWIRECFWRKIVVVAHALLCIYTLRLPERERGNWPSLLCSLFLLYRYTYTYIWRLIVSYSSSSY